MQDRPAPAHPRGSDQRKTRRIKVFVPTEIVVEDVAVRAHLLDISASGSRVHSHIAPRTGDQTRLNLNGETHAARIVWSEAGRSGLQFTAELTPNRSQARSLADRLLSGRSKPICCFQKEPLGQVRS